MTLLSVGLRAAVLAAGAVLLSGCLVTSVAGAAVGVAGTAVGVTAKAAGATARGIGAVIPGGKKGDKGGS